MKKVLPIVLLACIIGAARGQNILNNSLSDSTALLRTASASTEANMPKIVPVSPNAASLGIYGSIPVGHYTGVPNISIPIYEIDLGGKKIPISISYHSSGIKVTQEASTVGLGWVLNAGGCITKEVHGWDDFSYNAPFGYYHDTNFPVATENNDLDRTAGTLADRIANLVQYNANDKDPEPDLYSYNFGSYAGTAFFDKKTTDTDNYASVAQAIIRKGKDKLDIKRHTYVSAYNENDYWVITDVDGYKYYFGTAELTTNYWKNSAQYPQFTFRNKQHKVLTAWYLDSIVSPYANKVAFLYEFDNIQTITSTSEDVWYLLADTPPASISGNRGETYVQSYATINQALLKQIVLENGTITFDYTSRDDIKPVDSATKARKLSKISINNNVNTLNCMFFRHSYLGNSSNSTSCRLMLDTLSIGNENNVLQNYVFSYDRLPLPSKESFQFDYWGYYNGVSTSGPNFEIAPSALVSYYAYGHDQTRFFHGRDRRSDINYIQRGILKSIQYPTGGTTSFDYEMNEFSNTFVCSQKSPKFIANAYYFYDEDEPDDEGAKQEYGYDFEITGSSMSCLLEVQHYLRYTSRFDFTSDHICTMPSHVCIEKKGPSGYSMVTFFDIMSESGRMSDGASKTDKFLHTFSSTGTYRIRIIPESYEPQPDIYVSIWDAIDYELKQVDSGGGLRVKQVTDNFSTDQSITKKYYYQDDNGNSSGLLMTEPRFHCVYAKEGQLLSGNIYGGIVSATLHIGRDLYLGGYSSPFRPFGNSAMGAHVGYSSVEEIIEANGQNNGKIKYTFHNAIDDTTNLGSRFIRNFPATPNLNNGNPIAVISYNGQNIEIKKDSFKYEKLDATSIKGLKFMNTPTELVTNLISPDGVNDVELEISLIDYVAFKFYDLYSERWQLTKKTTSELFDGKWVTNIDEYNYNTGNWLPNHVKTHESTTKLVEVITTYSVDNHTAMKNRGILSAVTEQSTKINNQLTQKIVTDYKNWGNNLFAPEFIKIQTRTQSALETRLTYHTYDSKGKPLYISKDSVDKTVYLWGYRHQYPIVEIQNATYDQVKNALGGQTVIDGIANADTLSTSNATLLNNLRTNTNLQGAMVTTYTYKPLIGMQTATDPRGITTYYEYDAFGRLKRTYFIENNTAKTIQRYDYHYKN